MIQTEAQLQAFKELNNAWHRVIAARGYCSDIYKKAGMHIIQKYHLNMAIQDCSEMSTDLYRFAEDNTYTTRWSGIYCTPENILIEVDHLLAHTMIKIIATGYEHLLKGTYDPAKALDLPWRDVSPNALTWARDQYAKKMENEITRLPPG